MTTNFWKQLGIFFSIDIIALTLLQFIGQNVEPETTQMALVNISSFIMFLTLTCIMIKTTRLNNQYTLLKKFVLIFSFLTLNFVSIFSINYLNVFNRNINHQDIIEGIKLTLQYHLYILLPIVTIIGLILKTKTISNAENII